MNLPISQEQREKLKGYLSQSAQLMNEIDTLKEDIANVKSIVKEELGVPPKDYDYLVKVMYDKNKIEDEIEVRQSAISNVDILKGV